MAACNSISQQGLCSNFPASKQTAKGGWVRVRMRGTGDGEGRGGEGEGEGEGEG